MPNSITIKSKIQNYNKKIFVSGDKSLSIRWVLFSSLANGVSKAKNLLMSEDVLAALNAIRKLGIILLDKMNVTYRTKNKIEYISLKDFIKMAKKKLLNSDVIVFNNLVINKKEYNSLWEVPAISSWHARYF